LDAAVTLYFETGGASLDSQRHAGGGTGGAVPVRQPGGLQDDDEATAWSRGERGAGAGFRGCVVVLCGGAWCGQARALTWPTCCAMAAQDGG